MKEPTRFTKWLIGRRQLGRWARRRRTIRLLGFNPFKKAYSPEDGYDMGEDLIRYDPAKHDSIFEADIVRAALITDDVPEWDYDRDEDVHERDMMTDEVAADAVAPDLEADARQEWDDQVDGAPV